MDIFNEIRRDNLIGVRELIKELNVNEIFTESGESVLQVAIKSNASLELFMLLVEGGADIFRVDEEGVGLIDEAIKKGRLDIVRFLVQKGIDPNTTKRKSGFTPLMAAMAYGDEPITRYLVKECKVDASVKDTFDKTAADYAKMTGYEHLIRILEE
jgi:ankyrin repeat protein